MDETEDTPPESFDAGLKQMLGLFDTPAFARRGQDLEYALDRLHARLSHQREEMQKMVRLRLRQWAAAVEGPESWPSAFAAPIAPLWPAVGLDAPTAWGTSPASPRRRRAIARDLIASIERFNRRWTALVEGTRLDTLNAMVEHYNRYYLLEKECVVRSSRLAALHFRPQRPVTPAGLLEQYPCLPVPGVVG